MKVLSLTGGLTLSFNKDMERIGSINVIVCGSGSGSSSGGGGG